MKAKLLVTSAESRGEEFVFGHQATLGRSRDNTIRLEGKGVSSHHARIYFDVDRQRYFLEDLESLNGTTLDGLPVERPEPLDPLHVIGIAGVREFIFQELSRDPGEEVAGDDGPASEPTGKTSIDEEMPTLPANLASDDEATEPTVKTSVDEEMPPLPANLAGEGEEAEPAELTEPTGPANSVEDSSLIDATPTAPMPKTSVDEEMPALPTSLAGEVSSATATESEGGPAAEPGVADATTSKRFAFGLRLAGKEESEPVPLSEGERVVGRSRSADITVESRSVSRRHAVLTVSSGKVTLRDLESRNHTYVEGERVTGEVEVAPGARIRFGDLEAVLIGEESPK